MQSVQLAGKNDIQGYNTFEYPSDTVMIPRGLDLSFDYGVQPDQKFRSMAWGSITPSEIELEKTKGVQIEQDVWVKARARGQQNGYRSVEVGTYGYVDPPISNTMIMKEESAQVSAAVYNIHASSHLSGHADQAENFGRDLGVSRVLLRAPGDLITTTSKTYDDQTIQNPGGRASGYERLQFYR